MTQIMVIGGGTMGAAFTRAVTDAGVIEQRDITVCEVLPQRREWLEAAFPDICVRDGAPMPGAPKSGAPKSGSIETVVFLSVKPQDLARLIASFTDSLVISILAGSTISDLAISTGSDRIVRAMPNTPAQIGRGFTAWTATDSVSAADRDLVRQLLGALGEQLYVPDEASIDKITAVSGSGPAYVFLIIEAMVNAAVGIGLRPDDARRMVQQTLIGSTEFAAQSDLHIAQLKDMVTSPGGTTAAGLRVLEQRAVRAALIDAIAAAHDRAIALGQS